MRTFTMLAGLLVLGGCAGHAPEAGEEPGVAQESALTAAPFFGGDKANHATFATDVSVWETPLAQSEMDCFWDSGVRHVVVGTQEATIAQQQLAMAISRGMTVDACADGQTVPDRAAVWRRRGGLGCSAGVRDTDGGS